MILERIDTIRYLQSVLPRYDPSLLSPLQPFTRHLRVLVVPVTTPRGRLIGELEAEDLSALVGLQQRLPAVAVAHGCIKLHDVIARLHADHGLAAQLGQHQEEIALEVSDLLVADRVRLATAELVTVPELMVDAGMSSMTTSQYQNRLGTARRARFVILYLGCISSPVLGPQLLNRAADIIPS